MSTRSVQVLLATYNGEKFIRQQIESLLAQTYQDFEVIVADDGSTDSTLGIIEEIAGAVPGKIRIEFREPVGGAARNFMRLVGVADAPYVMFCDQDDVWLSRKVEVTMAAMLATEAERPSLPVLVHTDLQVVDESLGVVSPSLMAYQHAEPGAGSDVLPLLCNNYVTGCTAMVNRALVLRVRGDAPDNMLMHDWWFALFAAACGVIVYVDESTVLYRQHGANVIGAKPPSIVYFAGRFVALFRGEAPRRHLRMCSRQAGAFLERHGSECSAAARHATRIVAGLAERAPLVRRYLLVRHRLLRQGPLRNLAAWLVA